MAYATQTNLVERFTEDEIAQVADDGLGGIDATKVARALADADGEIDSYLRARYAVPIASPPAEVVNAACNIARYRLHDDAATEDIRRRYEDVRAWLRDVSKGAASIDAPATGSDASSSDDLTGGERNATAVSRSSPMVFTDSVLGQMP